jgi:hypothetical protein
VIGCLKENLGIQIAELNTNFKTGKKLHRFMREN